MSRHCAVRPLIRPNALLAPSNHLTDSLLYDRQPLFHLGYQPGKKQERPGELLTLVIQRSHNVLQRSGHHSKFRRQVHDISEA